MAFAILPEGFVQLLQGIGHLTKVVNPDCCVKGNEALTDKGGAAFPVATGEWATAAIDPFPVLME